MWYRININKYAVQLLPTHKRKPKFIAYIKVLISPIVSLHDEFLRDQAEDNHKLNHTGQICYLRNVLNDKFDNTLRRIYIGDGNLFDAEHIYTSPEEIPRFLGTMFLRTRDELSDTGVDFIVFVPPEILNVLTDQLTAQINYFKEGVKRYKLEAI